MANQEHLRILRQGIEVWNKWREEHPEVLPDLRETDLRDARLSGADLRGVNLVYTNLVYADLRDTDLRNTDLSHADLRDADLSHAILHNTKLYRANLSNTYLRYVRLNGADLSSTNLIRTNLIGADLTYADLTRARMGWTVLGDCNLRVIKGLETIIHKGPSPLSINTIFLSEGDIPEIFVKGTGAPTIFIEYMRSLVSRPIEFYSCFISYSSRDQAFAERLYADLQSKNVRCWYAPHNMRTGDRIRPRIYDQIWLNDKLLLVLSESSVASEWVDYEVETALARERKEKRDILFPIRLDNAVKESTAAWAAHIQSTRHITDFTRWKEHDEYQKGLTRLLRDLKQEATPDTIESDAHQDRKQSISRETQSQ